MSFGSFGAFEWLVILIIVLLLFGVGRISKVMGELGRGLRAFKEGLQGELDAQGQEEEHAASSSSERPQEPMS
ncbi:MAG: twin-arginine translocase TatA/TatE family subunit [Chloroflexi bacterium]|nr:twin-arginine translocase TatA/TatE family subunit [Chloroflexota bacterium]